MERTHPDKPFARYADDGVIHCRTLEEARLLPRSWTNVEGRLSASSYEGTTALVSKNGVPIFPTSGSSRDAPARDLALKIRCTLKNGEPAVRCSKQRCPSTVHRPPRRAREREPPQTEIVVKNHETEPKIGTDELLTSVPFFAFSRPLFPLFRLLPYPCHTLDTVLGEKPRTWTRSVGTKNCSSPALPKDGSTLLDEGRRTALCTLL